MFIENKIAIVFISTFRKKVTSKKYPYGHARCKKRISFFFLMHARTCRGYKLSRTVQYYYRFLNNVVSTVHAIKRLKKTVINNTKDRNVILFFLFGSNRWEFMLSFRSQYRENVPILYSFVIWFRFVTVIQLCTTQFQNYKRCM